MPPLKTYFFENELNSNITITIRAYSEESAKEILFMEVQNSRDYKLSKK